MADLFIDRVDTLNYVERLGVIRSLTRRVRVKYALGEVFPQDYSALKAAMNLIELPPNNLKVFSTLASLGHSSLVLVERAPQIAEGDPGCVDITLKYEHVLDGPHQNLLNATVRGMIFGKGKCSIADKTTNFFRPFGNPNADRVQIQVAHTYNPQTEPAIAAMPMLKPQTNPTTIYQGGEVSIPFPQANFRLEGVIKTGNPFLTGDKHIACINDREWLGKPAYTWICSEVGWDILDVDASTYKFTFEFQYNIDTWNPTVAFLDHRTNKPPATLRFPTHPDLFIPIDVDFGQVMNQVLHPTTLETQPAGVWTVPALKPVNFDQFFGGFMEGFMGGGGGDF